VVDRGDNNRVYVGIPKKGIARSDPDHSKPWALTNGDLPQDIIDTSLRIKLATYFDPATGKHVIYAGFIEPAADNKDKGQLKALFRTEDGAHWVSMGTPEQIHTVEQGLKHFSIVADANDPEAVYVGGDTSV